MRLAGGRRDSLNGLLSVAAAGLIWGTIPLALRAADGASVVKVFYRVFFAGIVILGWMLLKGTYRELRALPAAKVRQLMVQGAILTVNWVLFLTAIDLTKVATAELLGYLGPVFVAALAPFVTGERFDRRILVPLALALGGIVVILVPQGIGVASGRELLGAGLAFCSALTYSVLLLRSKKILRGVSRQSLMVIEYGVATALLAPFVVWAYLQGDGPSTPLAYGALLALGVVHTALAGLLFLSGLRRVRTDHAAVLTYAEPASAVIFAAIFLGEPLTVFTVVGGLMVVAGGALVARLEAGDTGFGPELAEPGDEGISGSGAAAADASSGDAGPASA